MKRNVELYIKDIIKYMERAEKYVEGLSHEQFLKDPKTCDAVIRCIEVLGEATKNIPENIRNKYSSLPWRDMAGMRDKIIHSYFIVDFEEVWLTVKEDIPKLKPLIIRILKEIEKTQAKS
jgi:uncharacterized protein with HEPN domain